MVEAAVPCVAAGLSVLCKDELDEAVGFTTCTSEVAVFFLSSSQLQSEGKNEEKKEKETDTKDIS